MTPFATSPVDLRAFAGVEAQLPGNALALRWGPDVAVAETEQRWAGDLAQVLREPGMRRGDDALYTLYKGVAPVALAGEIARRGLLFVTLVLRAGTVGREWTRTRGHVNSPAPGTTLSYPEVHEVWHGSGLLYLQRASGTVASDAVIVPLRVGDKTVVAPGWTSLLVNTGDTPLVVGSWRDAQCVPLADELASVGGMAHFLLRDENGGVQMEANPRYDAPPTPRTVAPHDLADFGLVAGEPMLATFHRNPDFLRFMLRPQDYAEVWASLYRKETE